MIATMAGVLASPDQEYLFQARQMQALSRQSSRAGPSLSNHASCPG
jgi:hypothetical protein